MEISRGNEYELEGYGRVEVTDLRRRVESIKGSRVHNTVVVDFRVIEPDSMLGAPVDLEHDGLMADGQTRTRPVDLFKELVLDE